MTMLSLLMWLAGMAVVDAQIEEKCATEQQQQGKKCQRACRCECDEYWNTDDFCKDVCDSTSNKPVVDELSWCVDYNVADECDIYGSDWTNNNRVKSKLDIVYMKAYGRDFKLNFFTDTKRKELLPLAVVIHGGGFNSGSKNNCKIIESAREFAARGFRTIAINYPMCGAYWTYVDPDEPVPLFDDTSSEGGWYDWNAESPLNPPYIGQQDPQCKKGAAHPKTHPEQYAQAAEVANRAARYAIQYAHKKANKWKIDVEQTVCHGGSAGALSCYEMFLFDTTVQYKPTTTGLPLEPDLDQIKINVAAGRAGGLTPARGVTQATVDAMVPGAAIYDLHGTEDDVVNITAAYFLMDEMEKYDIPATLSVIEGGGHSLFEYQFNKSHPERLNEMFTFIDDYLEGSDEQNFCKDNHEWIFRGNTKKNCGWVHKGDSTKLCKRKNEDKPKAKEDCPVACGTEKECATPKCVNDDEWSPKNNKFDDCSAIEEMDDNYKNKACATIGADEKTFGYEACQQCNICDTGEE